jgi:hypothetical protein
MLPKTRTSAPPFGAPSPVLSAVPRARPWAPAGPAESAAALHMVARVRHATRATTGVSPHAAQLLADRRPSPVEMRSAVCDATLPAGKVEVEFLWQQRGKRSSHKRRRRQVDVAVFDRIMQYFVVDAHMLRNTVWWIDGDRVPARLLSAWLPTTHQVHHGVGRLWLRPVHSTRPTRSSEVKHALRLLKSKMAVRSAASPVANSAPKKSIGVSAVLVD